MGDSVRKNAVFRRDAGPATVAGASTQHTSVRVEHEVTYEHVRQAVREICPGRSTISTLIHAEIGRDFALMGIRSIAEITPDLVRKF